MAQEAPSAAHILCFFVTGGVWVGVLQYVTGSTQQYPQYPVLHITLVRQAEISGHLIHCTPRRSDSSLSSYSKVGPTVLLLGKYASYGFVFLSVHRLYLTKHIGGLEGTRQSRVPVCHFGARPSQPWPFLLPFLLRAPGTPEPTDSSQHHSPLGSKPPLRTTSPNIRRCADG